MVVAVIQLRRVETTVVDRAGRTWTIYVQGGRRDDERWIGWIEFAGDDGQVRVTGRETTQPSFEALMYWAGGLEPIYFEGAFERSFPSSAPGLPLTGERLVA
jgi:hypothetical protein